MRYGSQSGIRRSRGWKVSRHTVQEERSGVVVRGHALEKGEGIAHSVGGSGSELGWVEQRVDRDDFLDQRCHNPCRLC